MLALLLHLAHIVKRKVAEARRIRLVERGHNKHLGAAVGAGRLVEGDDDAARRTASKGERLLEGPESPPHVRKAKGGAVRYGTRIRE